MKWWLIPVTVLWLIILGDGVAAFLAGVKCWQRRHMATIALPMALVLFGLAFESLNQIVNQLIHASELNLPLAYIVQQGIGRAIKGAATWYLAWQLVKD